MASADENEKNGDRPAPALPVSLEDILTLRPKHGDHTRCPLCGRPWEEAGQRSRDHVIPEKMGGVNAERAYVCQLCNHELGNELEGELVGSTGCLLPMASVYGWAQGRLGATTPGGEEYRWRPATAEADLVRPTYHVDTSVPGRTTLNISMPEQLFGTLDDITAADALNHGYVQRLIREHGPSGEDTTVEVNGVSKGAWTDGIAEIAIDLPRLRRLACKVALNVGALVWGDDFVSSALAHWLRVFLAAPGGRWGAESHPLGVKPLAARYGFEADRDHVLYLRDRARHPRDGLREPPQVQFRPVGPAGEGTWIGVYLLDTAMPVIVVPEHFSLSVGGSNASVIVLRQRPIKLVTAALPSDRP